MLKLLLLLLVFLIFISAAPLLIDEPGYISIAIDGMIYELTLYTAIFWILFVGLIAALVYVILKGSFNFSLGTWRKVAFAGQRRGIKDFNKGVAAYILEDYVQAEHLLAKSSEPSKRERMGYLLASSAASKQNLRSNTNHYLGLLDGIGNTVKEGNLESVIVTIKLLINQEEYDKARAMIDDHHKFVGHDARLLRLEIDLCVIEKRYLAAIDQLAAARKQKTITEESIITWEEKAFYGAFKQLITEQNEEDLTRYWNSLSNKIKHREAVVLAYCKVLAEHNIIKPLNKILLPAFKKGANKDFLMAIRSLPLETPEELITIAQKHVTKSPENNLWLSCLAHLCVANKQWDAAETNFNRLIELPEKQYDDVDLVAFAKTLEQLSQFEKATQVYRKLHS
jgi:HemY protein